MTSFRALLIQATMDYSSDWGVKYQATMRIGENDEDYTLGDTHRLSAWGGYSFAPWMTGYDRIIL